MSKMFIRAKLLKKRNLWINILIFVLSYLVLYRYMNKINIEESFSFIKDASSSSDFLFYIFSIFFLSILNWLIETYKWRLLVNEVARLSFYNSVKSILIGIFFSLFIPNRVGDFIGRIYSIPENQKGRLAVLTLFGSFAQLIATIFFGTLGFTYFVVTYFSVFHSESFYVIVFAVLIWIMLLVSITIFFNTTYFSKIIFFKRFRLITKIQSWLNVLQSLSVRKIVFVLLLSIFRYLVFSIQLWLCFRFLGTEVNGIDLLSFIAVYYLFLTFIPTVIYSEIGVRGSLSIYLFGVLMWLTSTPDYDYSWAVTFATVFVWFVNIVIPAIIGSFFTYRLKFFNG